MSGSTDGAAEQRARLDRILRERSAAATAEAPRPDRAPSVVRERSFATDRRAEILQRKMSVVDRWVRVHPYFKRHEAVTQATTRIDGREYLSFSTYNYLGLSGDPRVSAAARDAIDRFGTSPSASRVAAGEKVIHHELETAIAGFLGTEAALVFVGGHATNVSVIGFLCTRDDVVLYDAWSHNSIVQGVQLSGARARPFRHNDLEHLRELLEGFARDARRVLIVTEGVFSMDGDLPDLPALIALKRHHGALLMVDEAHSVGVLGTTGAGVGEHFGVDRADVDLWMGTLSKSFASCGGYIAGQRDLIQFLKYSVPGFLYSVGITPANAGAALEAIRVLRAEPERVARLHRNCALFFRLAQEAGLDTGVAMGAAVIPIIVGSSYRALKLSDALFARGINVEPMITPAVEQDLARLRFFITSAHSEDDLRRAVAGLVEEMANLPERRTILQQPLPPLPMNDPRSLPIFHVTDPEAVLAGHTLRLAPGAAAELGGFDPVEHGHLLAIARAFCADLAASDGSRVRDVTSDACEAVVPGPRGLPLAGRWEGRDALAAMLDHWRAAVSPPRVEARYVLAHATREVVVVGPWSSTLRATGEAIDDTLFFHFTFGARGGPDERRIVRFEAVVDPTPWLAAMRKGPAPAGAASQADPRAVVVHDPARAARLREAARDLYFQFVRKGDIEAFARVCHDDVRWEIDGPKALFFTGTWSGIAQVVELWSELAARMDFHEYWLDHVLVRGDEVYLVGAFRSTANETGLAYSDPFVHAITFRGDRLSLFREFFDPRIVLSAFRPDLVRHDG